MKVKFALALILLILPAGCAWFGNTKVEKPAAELIQDGVEAYDRGRYQEAIKNFEQLKDWYPFSKYAILAELKIADAHYHLQQYDEAVVAYLDFEQLHPRNEAIPYVIYQVGRCYYDRMDTIDRSQTFARKALETFQRLQRQYPENPHTRQLQSHIANCFQSLAGHDFYVGIFYFKNENYEAAMKRFMDIVTNYPDNGYHYQALQYISKCEIKLGANKQASALSKAE